MAEAKVSTKSTTKKAATAAAAKPAAKAAPKKAAPVKKAAAPKAATARKPAAKAGNGGASKVRVTPEQRYRMIAEAAYYQAEKRGFVGGDCAQDWLDAEAEIDSLLGKM